MAQVCKWLGVYLCMKEPLKADTIYPDGQAFDAVIVWRGTRLLINKGETTMEKSGGVAYEVILKPATTDSPVRPPSPPKKDRPLSSEDIARKLKEAEERRLSHEMSKLQAVEKTKERSVVANQRVAELNESFSKVAEKRLSEKLEKMGETREQQMKALQDRLKEHARRVEEVRQTTERYSTELKLRIETNMEKKSENREAQLKTIQERIREHEKQIVKAMEEVNESTNKFSKNTEEKLINKMNITMKNREDQLKQLQERLQEHEKHVEKVRRNKLENPCPEVVAQ